MIRLALALYLASIAGVAAANYAPFVATYEVWVNGKQQGESLMTLRRDQTGNWVYDVRMKGTSGLAKLLGAQVDQTTVFDLVDGRPRPLTTHSYSKVLLKDTEREGRYDWTLSEARWSGDLKPGRDGPVALQAGDLNSALINLSLVWDVQAQPETGRVLDYRMVEEGKVREYRYRIVGAEAIAVGSASHQALRVERDKENGFQAAWVVPGLPVPARLLQEEEGKRGYDMRLLKVDTGRVAQAQGVGSGE